MKIRIGHGYDIHRLVSGRKCILGGVEIPFELGLEGHSDADSLTHAVCDALLGAAGFADIGNQFPNTDERFRDIDSQELLREVDRLLKQSGFRIGNIDSTVVAERPKLQEHIPLMKRRLAETLRISEELVGIKATTNEAVGPVGRGEAIAAYAVCLIVSD